MQWHCSKNCRSVLYFGRKYWNFWLSYKTKKWREDRLYGRI